MCQHFVSPQGPRPRCLPADPNKGQGRREGVRVMSEQVPPATRKAAQRVPAVWGNVPQRNKNFTGREDLLAELRSRVTGDVTAVLAHALHGMGGVGKTQLAAEYAHRYGNEYDVVWWVPSDQLPLVRASLAGLAPRLGIEDIDPSRLEETVFFV